MTGFPTGRRTLGKVQPISKTTIPQNCLFDEFRRTYDRAYDLQFEGLQHLPPQSATGTLRARTMRRRYASLLHVGAGV